MARTRNTDASTTDAIVEEGKVVADDPEIKDESSVNDDVKENTSEENAAVAVEATSSSEPKPESEPKEKTPTTGTVAGAWIKVQLEDGPKTKAELIALAANNNPAKFENPKGKDKPKVPRSTKWIVEHKKIGQMCPGNAGGHYINEGLDSRKGGVDVLLDAETKTLRLK